MNGFACELALAAAAGLTTVREHGGTGRLDIWLAAQRKRLKLEPAKDK